MDFFIKAFMAFMGFATALGLIRLAPVLMVLALRGLTTKEWQLRKYRSLVARGQLDTAQWAKAYGFHTGE
jgi:hypothetical protein